MKMRKWEMTAGTLVLSTVLLAGCSTANSTAAEEMNVNVKVAQAQQGMIGKGDIYTGTVTPSETVNIMPKISGKVSSVAVDVGAEVKKGQLLLKLEDNDLHHNLDIAKSNIEAAQAAIDTAKDSRESGMVSADSGVVSSKSGIISSKNGITQAKGNINQAQGAVNQAQTAVKQAQTAVSTASNTIKQTREALANVKKTQSRTQSLFDNSLSTQAELDQADAAVVSAQTAYDNAVNAKSNAEEQLVAAQKSLQTAQTALSTAKEAYQNATNGYENASSGYENAQRQLEVSQSTAGINASQQKLAQAQLNAKIAQDSLDDTIVKSPINGIVTTKNIEAGEMAGPSAASIVIANMNTVNMLIYVPAEQINDIKAGDQVQVRIASSNIVTTGKVKNISPMDSSGNGYPVKVVVSNKDGKLKSGMLADVSFVSEDAKEGLIVPSKALQKDGDKTYVYVIAKGHAVRKEVQVGAESDSEALIIKGLNSGDQVAKNNLALLGDNTPVTTSQY